MIAKYFLGVRALIFIFALHVNSTSISAEEWPVDIKEKSQGAVVRIETRYYQSESQVPSQIRHGTGFFITRNGDLLTSAHLIEKSKDYRREIRIYPRVESHSDYTLANVIELDPSSDLAHLTVPGSNWTFIKLGDSNKITERTELMYIGFPGLGLTANSITPTFNKFTVSDLNASGYFRAELATVGGASGSPVLTREGCIVGMIVGSESGLEVIQTLILPQARFRSVISDIGKRDSPCPKSDAGSGTLDDTDRAPANGCQVIDRNINRPIEIRAGSCFLSPNMKYRATIEYIYTDAVRYVNKDGKKIICHPGEPCSFGWDDSPIFNFQFGVTKSDSAFLIAKD